VSIRFPSRGRKVRKGRGPVETPIGYIEFGGAMAAGKPMRLDLVAVHGKPKWEGRSEGKSLGNFSERTVIRLVRAVLRSPRIA